MTSLFPFCAVLFAAGFAARSYGAFHFGDVPAFIASTIMIYSCPYVPFPFLPMPPRKEDNP